MYYNLNTWKFVSIVTLRANKDLLEELRGDEEMSGALMEFVEPWIQERERDAEIRGKVIGTIESLRVFYKWWGNKSNNYE